MKPTRTKDAKGYPSLFSPFPLGAHTLKNRVVALPVHTGFARPDGRVSQWMVDFYTRLAGSGAAMVVVANAAVSGDGVVSRFNLRADRDETIPGLARLASAIRSREAVSCLQLNHAGRFAKTPRPLLPSPITAGNLAFNVDSLKEFMEFFPFEKRFNLTRRLFSQIATWASPMTDGERERVTRDFGRAAARAEEAGFDMVELHGANGYLLCQYLSEFTNRLPEEFGGDTVARAAFPLAVIREIKKRVNLPLGLRLILEEWVPGGIDLDQALAFAGLFQNQNLAYLSASAATYNSLFTPWVRKRTAARAYLEKETAALTRAVNIPTIISGRITTPACADRLVREKAADLIGLGRPLRADPLWVDKALSPGRKIIPCLNCNHCLKQVILENGFCCPQWPQSRQMKTRLEHKLLTRPDKSLWVVAHPLDTEVFKSYLPLVHRGKKALDHQVLFLSDPGQGPESGLVKKQFLEWIAARIDPAGVAAMPHAYSIFAPPGDWENIILEEIRQGDQGRVFLAALQDQPWRERMLYRTRGKMTALLNAHPASARGVVLVDLSETTLLVLRTLSQTLMKSPSFSFDFIYVDTGSGTEPVHTWKEALEIAGIHSPFPLERIRAKTGVVQTLAPLIRKRGYGTVVMGKRGLSGIKRWLMGSVSSGLFKQLNGQSVILID